MDQELEISFGEFPLFSEAESQTQLMNQGAAGVFPTQPIDQEKARKAILNLYESLGELTPPKFSFFTSPDAAFKYLIKVYKNHPIYQEITSNIWENSTFLSQFRPEILSRPTVTEADIEYAIPEVLSYVGQLGKCRVQVIPKTLGPCLAEEIEARIYNELDGLLNQDLFGESSHLNPVGNSKVIQDLGVHFWSLIHEINRPELMWEIEGELEQSIRTELGSHFSNKLWRKIYESIRKEHLEVEYEFGGGIYPDSLAVFSHAIALQLKQDKRDWPRSEEIILPSLVENCGWIFPFKFMCLVCDRPTNYGFDDQGNFHGENQPAIQFADASFINIHHGLILPKAYQVSYDQWRADWLLTETNAELRRMLIQTFGYERICQELKALEIDRWQEYTLLQIPMEDEESIQLLKMTCPSTNHIHVLRVPPEMTSAREAIAWVNWGHDPQEFVVQT
ncbi:DUF6745 domain-containing protein [Neosynechococcus sphagnicola]|uniref:DUF6745 domain-containing protein n=1 Tax=Neosynechococcus sphagnicola TaxID=1501145 RepID=UPI000689A58C|nr:hypothetical protein [Neosynechococcus sphagnicola]